MKLSQETLGFIGSGNVYVHGKCRDESTNIYIQTNPKIRSEEIDEFCSLVRFLLLLVRNTTCVPIHQERVNLILNLDGNSCSKLFVEHLLLRLKYMLIKFLPFVINRIIVVGALGEVADKFADFKKKLSPMSEIIHVDVGQFKSLHKVIDPEQLEIKFGGFRPNISEYWPPNHHTSPGESVDEEHLASLRLIPFFIYDEDYQTYVATHLPKEVVVKSRAFLAPQMPSRRNCSPDIRIRRQRDPRCRGGRCEVEFGPTQAWRTRWSYLHAQDDEDPNTNSRALEYFGLRASPNQRYRSRNGGELLPARGD